MAFNKLLACVASACAVDICAIPTSATTAKTVAHVFASLVTFLTVYGICSPLYGVLHACCSFQLRDLVSPPPFPACTPSHLCGATIAHAETRVQTALRRAAGHCCRSALEACQGRWRGALERAQSGGVTQKKVLYSLLHITTSLAPGVHLNSS